MIIIDATVIMGIVLNDEKGDYSLLVMQELRDDRDEGTITAICFLECLNTLIKAHANRRISRDERVEYQDIIFDLPFFIDYESVSIERIPDISNLADRFGLRSYDAAYLDLAIRKKCPLATNDLALQKAARTLGLFYQI